MKTNSDSSLVRSSLANDAALDNKPLLRHTPGPWFCDIDNLTVYSSIEDCVTASAGGAVESWQWSNSQNMLEANAKLIASAPALLAALERVAMELGDNLLHRPLLNSIREAIAKAME